MRPLGGMVFGHLGDRWGRRTALALSVLVMACATLAVGLLPTYGSIGAWAPLLLLICRLLQGFSVGGEYVGANILILEHASAGRSGRWVSSNQIAGYLGISTAAATSLLLARALGEADLTAWGWRLPFFAAAPLGLIGLYLRLRVPDSPAFRAAAAKRLAFPLGVALRTAKRGMLTYGAWFAMVGLGGYLLHGYLASYLIRVVGLDATGAFGASLAAVLGLAVGALAGGHLVDRYPPRRVAIGAAVGITVTVVPGFLIIQRGSVAAAIVGEVPLALCLGVAATFGFDEVLAVVHDQQQFAVGQVIRQQGQRGYATKLAQPQGHRDGLRQQRLILQPVQLDQPDPVRERPPDRRGNPQRQPALAHPADPGQRHQPRLRQPPLDVGHRTAAPDKAGQLLRKIVEPFPSPCWHDALRLAGGHLDTNEEIRLVLRVRRHNRLTTSHGPVSGDRLWIIGA